MMGQSLRSKILSLGPLAPTQIKNGQTLFIMFQCTGQSTRIDHDLRMCIATVGIGRILKEEEDMCRLFEC
jgi:hypothetical protein